MPSPAAQAHLDEAASIMQSYDFAGSADATAKAFAEDPDDLEVNLAYLQRWPMRHYIYAPGKGIELSGDQEVVTAEVKEWQAEQKKRVTQRAADEPGEAKWHYLLATLAGKDEKEQARHLADCLTVDPGFAKAYAMRGLMAQKRGDNAAHLADLRKVAELSPGDPGAMFSAAYAEEGADRVAALIAFADAYPDHDRVAQALSQAAEGIDDDVERIAVMRRAVLAAGPEGHMVQYVGSSLLEELVEVDTAEAASTAESLGQPLADAAITLRALVDAEVALAAGDHGAALASLDSAPSPAPVAVGRLARTRVSALVAAGDIDAARAAAVDSLTASPSQTMWALAEKTADRAAIEAQVWEARVAAGRPAPDFDLPLVDGGRVSLASQAGRVTLLNFWYPGCGPCRNEYRYLAPAIEAFDGRPFDVVAVNTVFEEDDLVAPFMAGNSYPFVATLFEPTVVTAYEVRGTPSNFLIDHEGCVVAKPRIHSRATAAAAMLVVEEAISRAERAQ